jgi:hypothetical protein
MDPSDKLAPCPLPTTPPPDGTGRDKKFSLWCAILPRGRKREGFQTLTIGNDGAAKLLTSHNLERYLSGFNSRASTIYQAFQSESS